MIPIEVAVKGSKRLEGLLEKRFSATGRGLHDKLSSVEDRIPDEVRRSIRWVATIRNKVVHEEGPAPAEESEFVRTVDRVARALEGAGVRAPAARDEGPSRSRRDKAPQRPKRAKAPGKRATRATAKAKRAPARSRRRPSAPAAPRPRPAAWAVTILILLLAVGLAALWTWK